MTTNLERQIEGRLHDHDVRMTRGRRTLVRALDRADGPRSAADLHGELGDAVPLSSIYRSLAVLEDVGIVSPHYSSKGVTRYELADWLTGHHHHLLCTSCGLVEDFELEEQTETELEHLVARVGTEISFSPSGHVLEIEGLCSRCR